MNIDSILISEYAASDGKGRLTVVNTFNRLEGPGPKWGLPAMYMTLVIHGHRAEAGSRHKGEVRVIDAQRKLVEGPIEFEFPFNADDGSLDDGIPLRAVVTLAMIGVSFGKPGPYAFEVHIDGIWHQSASFVVRKTPKK
jgi:hypothetical protein